MNIFTPRNTFCAIVLLFLAIKYPITIIKTAAAKGPPRNNEVFPNKLSLPAVSINSSVIWI